MSASCFIVFVTAPSMEAARELAAAALEARAAACANLLPGVESHYWWQGELEKSAEVLIVFKTTQAQLPALEKTVLARHPYDTPEFVALPIAQGSARYLQWIADSVKPVS